MKTRTIHIYKHFMDRKVICGRVRHQLDKPWTTRLWSAEIEWLLGLRAGISGYRMGDNEQICKTCEKCITPLDILAAVEL